jgi:hypothetical protein
VAVRLSGYILPWNPLYGVAAVLVWLYLTPSVETLQSFAPGWIALVLARNAGLVVQFFGAFHLRLAPSRSPPGRGRGHGFLRSHRPGMTLAVRG